MAHHSPSYITIYVINPPRPFHISNVKDLIEEHKHLFYCEL